MTTNAAESRGKRPRSSAPAKSPAPAKGGVATMTNGHPAAGVEPPFNLPSFVRLITALTNAGTEARIMQLATRSAAVLGVRFEGPYFVHTSRLDLEPDTSPPELSQQLESIGVTGGPFPVSDGGWAWAYPVVGGDGERGFVLALADAEPSEDERLELTVLAGVCGLAVLNVRSRNSRRAAAEELRHARQLFQRRLRGIERLASLTAARDSPQQLATLLHELTELPVVIEDRHGGLLAWAGARQAPPERPQGSADEEIEGRGVVRLGDRLAIGVEHDGEVAAVLALFDRAGSNDDQHRVLLECAAMALSLQLSGLQSSYEAEQRLHRDLVEELLAGTDDSEAVLRAQLLGHDLREPYRVALISCEDGEAEGAAVFESVRRSLRDMGSTALLSPHDETVVVIAEDRLAWDRLLSVLDESAPARPWRIGVGRLCAGEGYAQSYREAQTALRLQRSLGLGPRLTVFDDLGVFRLFAEVDEPANVQDFIMRWLGPLLEYDAAKGADLVSTLSEYLEAGGNYDSTAQSLILHRSTLRYRLRRIRQISGLDLAEPDVRFNLQLATRALRTLEALGVSERGTAPSAPAKA